MDFKIIMQMVQLSVTKLDSLHKVIINGLVLTIQILLVLSSNKPTTIRLSTLISYLTKMDYALSFFTWSFT